MKPVVWLKVARLSTKAVHNGFYFRVKLATSRRTLVPV